PMVLERVLRIENFYQSMSPIHFELRPDGKGPEERESPTHSYADTCNVFGRRGFQVHVPSLAEIDELGQLQIIAPIGISDHGYALLDEALSLRVSHQVGLQISPHAVRPTDRNLFERQQGRIGVLETRSKYCVAIQQSYTPDPRILAETLEPCKLAETLDPLKLA